MHIFILKYIHDENKGHKFEMKKLEMSWRIRILKSILFSYLVWRITRISSLYIGLFSPPWYMYYTVEKMWWQLCKHINSTKICTHVTKILNQKYQVLQWLPSQNIIYSCMLWYMNCFKNNSISFPTIIKTVRHTGWFLLENKTICTNDMTVTWMN